MSVTSIYIDIETIPGPTPPAPGSISAPANYKNPETIAEYQRNSVEKEWRRESLLSHRGRVLCVGWAVEDDDVRSVLRAGDGEEPDLMHAFWDGLLAAIPRESARSIRWVGFNLTTFDLNWLRHRAVKYGLRDLSYQLPAERYPRNVFDIRSWWLGPDYRGEGTLDDVAKFFGIEGKTAGMDGSQVFDYWRDGRLDEIAEYCRRDVELTRELHQRITA